MTIREGIRNYTIPVVLFFAFLYGYSVHLYSGDILRYREAYESVRNYEWSDYFYLVRHALDSKKIAKYETNVVIAKPDVFALTLQFLVSRFTENPRVFWAVLSTVYTYIILLFLIEVLKMCAPGERSWPELVFQVCLLTCVPFYVGVTGVRFWTALFFFTFCIARYIRTERDRYVALSLLAVAIHYAFIVPVALLCIFRVTKLSHFLGRILAVVSIGTFLVASTTDLFGFFQKSAELLDEESVRTSVSSYVDSDVYQFRMEQLSQVNWYVPLSSNLLLAFLAFLGVADLLNLFNLRESLHSRRFLGVCLMFFALTVLVFDFASIARYKNVFFLLVAARYCILFSFNRDNMWGRRLSYVLIPILLFYNLVMFRAGLYTVDPLLLVGNPLTLILTQSPISLSELIVGH